MKFHFLLGKWLLHCCYVVAKVLLRSLFTSMDEEAEAVRFLQSFLPQQSTRTRKCEGRYATSNNPCQKDGKGFYGKRWFCITHIAQAEKAKLDNEKRKAIKETKEMHAAALKLKQATDEARLAKKGRQLVQQRLFTPTVKQAQQQLLEAPPQTLLLGYTSSDEVDNTSSHTRTPDSTDEDEPVRDRHDTADDDDVPARLQRRSGPLEMESDDDMLVPTPYPKD